MFSSGRDGKKARWPALVYMNAESKKPTPKPNHIFVAVVTTAGSSPSEGFDEVPVNQKIKVALQHAARELGIPSESVENWVATVAGREINTSQSYADAGLSGEISISWGPRETGGGRLR
jgi:hypothetical protein